MAILAKAEDALAQADAGGPNASKLVEYRPLGMLSGSPAIYHKGLWVGKTRALVGG